MTELYPQLRYFLAKLTGLIAICGKRLLADLIRRNSIHRMIGICGTSDTSMCQSHPHLTALARGNEGRVGVKSARCMSGTPCRQHVVLFRELRGHANGVGTDIPKYVT